MMGNCPSRLSVDLARRVRDELGIPLRWEPNAIFIRRTRAGRHQRAAGAWSWVFHPASHIGSAERASDLLKAPKLAFHKPTSHSYEIGVAMLTKDPCPECGAQMEQLIQPMSGRRCGIKCIKCPYRYDS